MRALRLTAATSITLLLLITASAGCTKSQTAPTTTLAGSPLKRFAITASPSTDPFAPADGFNKPAVGTRFVAVQITIKNTGTAKATVEPARWIKGVTKSGSVIEPAVITSQPGDISAGGPKMGILEPGEELTGIMVFEVPVADSISSLKYRDDLVPPETAQIQIG